MFVIVEGPKCCGKSTLCSRLQAKFGGTIIHFPTNSIKGQLAMNMLSRPLSPTEYNECQRLMEEDINETLDGLDKSQLWILDRSFISNAVYRQTEHVILKDKYLSIIDESMVIMMLATDETLLKWIAMRTEKPLTELEYAKLSWSNERFHKVAQALGCQFLSKEDEVKEIKVGTFYRAKKSE